MGLKQSAKFLIMAVLTTASLNAMSATTYRIKAGDSLDSISKQFNVSKKDLMELNNIKSENTILVGDTILLKDSVAVRYAGKTTAYTVQTHDTLGSIVRKFDTTIAILVELNPSLANDIDQIQVGQRLIVPQKTNAISNNNNIATATANTPTITKPEVVKKFTGKNSLYTVQRGDTLSGIANRFNIKASDLAKVNNVDATYKVKIGENIYVPEIADSLQENKVTTTTTATPTTTEKTSVTKKTNKTTEGPASKKPAVTKVNTTKVPEAIPVTTSSNSKASSPLKIDTIRYTVKSGDSLLGLAKRYNVTLSSLAELNGLKTNSKLKIDQKLLIPVVQK